MGKKKHQDTEFARFKRFMARTKPIVVFTKKDKDENKDNKK